MKFGTYEERYRYLALRSSVGIATFGSDRWLNQQFYTSREWRHIRDVVIVRDNGCDMGVEGFEIHKGLYIHHMNPITVEDLTGRNDDILDPEHLITVTLRTHNAIHYGDERSISRGPVERRPGDTKLW